MFSAAPMNFLIAILGFITNLFVFEHCNPVPIPGTVFFHWHNQQMMQTVLTDYNGFHRTDCEGEGCRGTASTAEATMWQKILLETPANSGYPPPMRDQSLVPPLPQTGVHKRSYKRACRRALRYGTTHYHGHRMHIQDFPKSLVQKLSQEESRRPHYTGSVDPNPNKAKRLKVLYWNAGGMSQATFLEFKHWLCQHPHDLVVTAETRWSFSSTWEDRHWSYIHSATSEKRSGGLMIMIAKSFAHTDQLGFDEVEPGRLLHARVHGPQTALDILALYQYTDYRTEISMRQRERIWTALDGSLRGLPTRNNLICAGDFNCNLQYQSPWVGSTLFTRNHCRVIGSQHSDQPRLQELLRVHGLTALNTWNSSGATFVHGPHAARIDFLMTRIVTCDGYAKYVTYHEDADFMPSNQSHHIPMTCHIRKQHAMYHQQQKPVQCSYAQRNQCRLASQEDAQTWHLLRQQVVAAVSASDPEAAPDVFIRNLHDAVSAAFHQLFPNRSVRLAQPNFSEFHQVTEDKWFHKRCLKALHPAGIRPSLQQVFQAWFHRCRYGVLQRLQQRKARQAHQQRFQQLCQEVDVAANHHDSHTMFSIINKFSPKRPRARARLKGPDGRIADQYLAQSMTIAYVQQMWTGPDTLPRYCDRAPGVPFTLDMLTRALTRLHVNKSVAPPFLPAIIWKSAPLDVASALYHHLQAWWSHSPPYIPQVWKDSWLSFIPKPGKPNTHPSQMRPISLMEPLGKMVLGIIASLIKQYLGPHLIPYPHFGFMPERAATDAIQRVASHSRDVRALVGTQRRSVVQQMTQVPKLIICGGLSLFLDMSRAFDCVNRRVVFDHLMDLNTPPELVQIVASWHEQTQYNLQFNHVSSSIPVGKGLRQGCKIAPQLWVIYMDKFLKLLEARTGPQWVAACLTVYADDVHVGCQYQSTLEFNVHLRNLGFVLDSLEQLDLELSYQKSFILHRYAGTNPRPTLKGRIRRQGTEHFLLVPRQTGTASALPLRTKGSYLGAVLSYNAFELQTWTHRKKSAWLAFTRLRNWLRHRDIAVRQRLYLWKQCVFTVMTYSILATGVSLPILHEFQITIYRMIRIVLGDHSYHTHHTHMQVFRQYHIDHPLDMLRDLAISLLQRVQRRDSELDPTDFLHRVDWNHLNDTIRLISSIRASDVEVPIASDPTAPVQTQALLSCPSCAFSTTSVANLRRHLTNQHGKRQFRTAATNPAEVSLHGSSQCKRCFQIFTTWKSFFIHVQRNCCQVVLEPEMPPDPTPAAGPSRSADTGTALPGAATLNFHIMLQTFWPELQIRLMQADWTNFPRDAEMLEYLSHHCAICGLWCNRFQELHGHFRQAHREQAHGCVAKGVQIASLMQLTSPCTLCQRAYSRIHSCPVTLQLGMLLIQVRPAADRNIVACTCDICGVPFNELGALYGHLTNHHGMTVNDWCPSRDSHQGGDGCRHCGQIFDSRSGLRRHITEGRCEAFNPLATPHPNDTTASWGTWLATGNFDPGVLTAQMRLRLSNTCQFCGLAYSRTGDLVAHLLQSHGDLWTSSLPWLRFLLQAVMARRGCLCNPQSTEVGVTHICTLFRQVAMMLHSQDIQLMVPTQFLRDDLETKFLCLQNDALQRISCWNGISLNSGRTLKCWQDLEPSV